MDAEARHSHRWFMQSSLPVATAMLIRLSCMSVTSVGGGLRVLEVVFCDYSCSFLVFWIWSFVEAGEEEEGMWVDVINTYAGSPLNRLNNERKEVDLFVRVEASPKAVCVVFDGRYQVLASKEGCLAWIERDRLWEKLTGAGVEENSVTEAFLGEWDRMEDGVWTCFAVQVASGLNGMFDELCPEAKFVNLRAMSVSKNISMEELAVAAHGKALMEFHRRHRFCGLCGAETVAEEGATKRRCQRNIAGENARHDVPGTCPGMWFPRTDPVVICVVVDGNRCLLGRKKEWPHGVYSALAGFMEHGESCEDAVRREVKTH